MTNIHTLQSSSKSIFCALCLSAVLFLSSCTQEEKQDLQAPLRQVRTMVLDAGSGMFETSFSGRLHASRETNYSFKVSGTIREIAVNVGDRINKGDVLARLDPSTYALEAQKSKASLAEAQSELRNAKANYARVQKLYIGGNGSRSELDNARAASESALAAVASAQKALEIAQLNLSYTKLTADEACAIASVDAEEGENVAQGTRIFYTTCGNELEVKLEIPETVIAGIKKGMAVTVTFSAMEGKTYTGMVNEVGVASVQGGTTFPVTIIMTDPRTHELMAGLSADVVFLIKRNPGQNEKNRAIIVPAFAVGEDQVGRYAFILETTQDGRAMVKRQPVIVGNVLQTGIEVTHGLIPGMRIVTAGVSVLRNGMEVKNNGK